jgi:GNAT superfamily N-acetyltransferase
VPAAWEVPPVVLYSVPVGVTPGFQIYPVTPDRLDDVADLFNSNGATRGCWCMFFLLKRQDYFTGRRGGNEVVFRELTSQGDVPLGLVAYRGEKPVGWVAAGPRSRYATATAARSRILKERDPAEDEDVWLVPCFFVRVGARRAGLTRALLKAAVELAEDHGAKAVEGFPLAAGPKAGADGFLGTEQVFAGCGFIEVARPTDRRVVMRRELRPRHRQPWPGGQPFTSPLPEHHTVPTGSWMR